MVGIVLFEFKSLNNSRAPTYNSFSSSAGTRVSLIASDLMGKDLCKILLLQNTNKTKELLVRGRTRLEVVVKVVVGWDTSNRIEPQESW